MKRKPQRFWLAVWTLATTASLAHEGHVHPDDSIPLWQIVMVIVVAVAVYFFVNAVLKHRQQNSTTEAHTSNEINNRD